MSVDQYLSRIYHPRHYNCAHLVCEFWLDNQSENIYELMRGFLCGKLERKGNWPLLKQHVRFISSPKSPCVVLMQSPRVPLHVGIWVRGKVLQITQRGVTYWPLEVATVGYRRIRFFKCNM